MGKIANIDLRDSLEREWLVTNGLGGFSSSTITNLNTRRYHGLLIASFDSPEDRRLLLSKVEEEFLVDGIRYPIYNNMYRSCVDPIGFIFQTSFETDPLPKFTYKIGGIKVKKTIFMPHETNTVVIKYSIDNPGSPALFKSNFLLTSRDLHCIVTNPTWEFQSKSLDEKTVVFQATHQKAPFIGIKVSEGGIVMPKFKDPWLRKLYYKAEEERGFECLEDLYIGATWVVDIKNGKKEFYMICSSSLSEDSAIDICNEFQKNPNAWEKAERERLTKIKNRFYHVSKIKTTDKTKFLDQLVLNADDFIVKKADLNTIIAGYPWFTEWGRDSSISLPGLCLVAGRFGVAEKILLDMIRSSRGGLIPNDYIKGPPEYKSADASLWFFWAVWKYLEYTKNYNFVKENLWDGMKSILREYIEGTNYGIKLDNDGLIVSNSDTPLTWMDAVVDGVAITPRRGKAVEIQALWYNALRTTIELCKEFDEDYSVYESQSFIVKENFPRVFWNKEDKCLYDSVYGKQQDGSIRPNQIFAVSMPFSMLERRKEKSIVEIVKNKLLTPYGLRSLAKDQEGYIGVHKGNAAERDHAYHQGTVWPWLLGSFITAYVKVNDKSDKSKKESFEFLKPLLENHLCDAKMGGISEVFDGDSPHKPGGCIAQAWSVAEILRVLVEDIGV